jgi:hypothetical protein
MIDRKLELIDLPLFEGITMNDTTAVELQGALDNLPLKEVLKGVGVHGLKEILYVEMMGKARMDTCRRTYQKIRKAIRRRYIIAYIGSCKSLNIPLPDNFRGTDIDISTNASPLPLKEQELFKQLCTYHEKLLSLQKELDNDNFFDDLPSLSLNQITEFLYAEMQGKARMATCKDIFSLLLRKIDRKYDKMYIDACKFQMVSLPDYIKQNCNIKED